MDRNNLINQIKAQYLDIGSDHDVDLSKPGLLDDLVKFYLANHQCPNKDQDVPVDKWDTLVPNVRYISIDMFYVLDEMKLNNCYSALSKPKRIEYLSELWQSSNLLGDWEEARFMTAVAGLELQKYIVTDKTFGDINAQFHLLPESDKSTVLFNAFMYPRLKARNAYQLELNTSNVYLVIKLLCKLCRVFAIDTNSIQVCGGWTLEHNQFLDVLDQLSEPNWRSPYVQRICAKQTRWWWCETPLHRRIL